jgi:predicted transposase YbfD/YdcC
MSKNESTKPALENKPKIIELAERIPDPRSEKFKKHSLTSIVFIALIGTVCGANDWVTIVDTAEHLKDWIRQYVDLPFGIPSHDTFTRTFGLINNQIFNQFLIDWADHLRMKSVGRVIRRRTYGDRSTFERCYYIMSLEIDAKLFAHAVRGHWEVENNLHWSLDVIFREDHSKYRDRVGAQNLSAVRKIGLGLLKKNESIKKSLARKRFQALTSVEFREIILKDFLQ